jgi:plasmid maintenance system antidote protein VapI
MTKHNPYKRNHSALSKKEIKLITERIESMGVKKAFVAKKLGVSPSDFTRIIKGKRNVFEPERKLLRDVLNFDESVILVTKEAAEEWKQ